MRIILGISGASGVILGYEMLKALKRHNDMEVHLIVSEGAKKTLECETDLKLTDLTDIADFTHSYQNMAACVSSGSFVTDGMIVIPCSMKSLSEIATGNACNLLARAVDVCLKESRKVVLVPREMPLSKIHLRNLATAAGDGCTIMPPVLTFYNGPVTIQDQINHIIGKILMQFGLEHKQFVAWEGEEHQ